MKKVLITGGSGFFGKSIKDYYSRHASDFEFVSLSRHNGSLIGDVSNFQFPDEQFDAIIHLASPLLNGIPDSEIYDVIMSGTRHIAKLAQRDNAVLLFASSGAVYQKAPRAVSEEDPCEPMSGYGRAKLAAERYFIDSGLNVKIARCFSFVGKFLPRIGNFAIGNFMENCRRNEPIVINGDGSPMRSFLYADDLVEWLFAILERGVTGRPYNVGSDEAISIKDLAMKIKSSMGSAVEIKVLGAPVVGASHFYVPNVDRARNELGLEIKINLRDSIRKSAGE